MDKHSNLLCDMKHHEHVTTLWPRCSRVEIQGDHLACTVDWKRTYDLAVTPKRAQLHIRFLRLKTNQDLAEFIRAWGPLWAILKPAVPEHTIMPSVQCWAFQRRLKAGLQLARNARPHDAAWLRSAILEYIAADDDYYQNALGEPRKGPAGFFMSLIHEGRDVHPRAWLPEAPLSVLRRVATECPGGSFSFALRAAWKDGQLHYRWQPTLYSLGEAIELELWSSLAGVRPVTICDECQTPFLPDSAHPRKFCSYRCAHRSTVRAWRKNTSEARLETKGGKHAKAKKA